MDKKSRILIFYKAQTQYANLGDQVINRLLLEYLRGFGTIIVDDTGVPEWYLKELRISEDECLTKSYGLSFTTLLLCSGVVNLLGESNFRKIYFVLHPGHHYGEVKSFILSLKEVMRFALFRTLGIRICSFGTSIGPFTKSRQVFERLRARFMYFYSVRDGISETYAQKIGIDKVRKFPDMAWFISPHKVNSAGTRTHTPQAREYVVFSFRRYTYGVEQSRSLADVILYQERLFEILDSVIEWLCMKQKKLVISYQVRNDREFCESIQSKYSSMVSTVFIDNQLDFDSMHDLYSNAHMIFSNRLHVLIFSMTLGVLPIAVIDAAMHKKIAGIFSDAGLMQLVLDINNINKGFVNSSLLRIADDSQKLKSKISVYHKRVKNSGLKVFSEIFC